MVAESFTAFFVSRPGRHSYHSLFHTIAMLHRRQQPPTDPCRHLGTDSQAALKEVWVEDGTPGKGGQGC